MEQGESPAPQFIKDFAKNQSPDQYQQTVQAIKNKRQEFHQQRNNRREKQSELQHSTTERQETLDETLTNLHTLRDRVDELSTSGFKKLISYFRLRKIRADINVGEKSYQELKQQQESETAEQQRVAKDLKTPPELQEAKDILNNFYQNQKEKWANSDYTKEDIQKYFTEEYLSSLSLQDYILLLKRFPSEMVAHVTRQGIRDHIGMFYHNAGAGEYSDGFMRIVKDGRLRSPLGVALIEGEKKESIIKFLQLDILDKPTAMGRFDTLFTNDHQGIPGSYADRAAIHFATEEVADCYYGSEKGNEIFMIYPSALIASQYHFSGQLNESGGGYWNDQWVWANEERGININAGIIFIPAKTQVDSKTGSRYQLNENNQPTVNSEYHSLFRQVIDSNDFDNLAEQIKNIVGYSSQKSPLLEPFRQILEQKFNIKDRRLQNAIFRYQELNTIQYLKKDTSNDSNDKINDIINDSLIKEGVYFEESQDAISAQEFWENYFNQHPQQRPSKIVYYEGQDPTKALQQWKKENHLTNTTTDTTIGFEERRIQPNNPIAATGIDRFKTLAEEVVNDYYTA